MKVATDIYELRLERGLTQATLAERAGMSRRTLLRIENEEREPTPAQLYDIAEELDCDVDVVETEIQPTRPVPTVIEDVLALLSKGVSVELAEMERFFGVEVRLRSRT